MAPKRYETEHKDPAPLGKPLDFAFSKKTAQNRFLKGAMTERLSSWDPQNLEARGVPSKNLINVYRRWGEGEFGVILTGNIMIEYDHLEAAGNPIIPRGSPYSGERFDAFKEMATQSKKHGSLIVGQVSHPGRQVADAIQKSPVSASDVQLEGNVMGMTFAKPRAATDEDIKNIIEGFAHAAEYMEKAGYDGIQLHGAHGYLLAQFLSPSTNKRTDKYGGSLENRARLITEIGQEVRKRTSSSFVLGIKLNSVEFQEKGFDTAEAATRLRRALRRDLREARIWPPAREHQEARSLLPRVCRENHAQPEQNTHIRHGRLQDGGGNGRRPRHRRRRRARAPRVPGA
jgi:2,4-dienoyl-CoA reductase-like NADH-dependent reductase (Old Yellow Enzyme family)